MAPDLSYGRRASPCSVTGDAAFYGQRVTVPANMGPSPFGMQNPPIGQSPQARPENDPASAAPQNHCIGASHVAEASAPAQHRPVAAPSPAPSGAAVTPVSGVAPGACGSSRASSPASEPPVSGLPPHAATNTKSDPNKLLMGGV